MSSQTGPDPSMRLGDLLRGLEAHAPRTTLDLRILGLATDSRRAGPGDAFFCGDGSSVDGRDFAGQAESRGAVVAVGSRPRLEASIPYARVADPRQALALAAHRLHDDPTSSLRLAGITGTSGKTTTAYALERVLTASGLSTAVLGTLGHRFADKLVPAPSTCPQAHDLAGLLRQMADAGVQAAAMEVTSHALAQRRTDGCRFEAVAFTNFSRSTSISTWTWTRISAPSAACSPNTR